MMFPSAKVSFMGASIMGASIMDASIMEGCLRQAQQCASPNCNERPPNTEISLLVIHNISLPPGEYGGGFVQALFCNELDCSVHPYFSRLAQLQVSAHLLIEREGRILQFVPFHQRAWHAGESVYQGRDNCNDFSIGIELEGCDDEPYTEQQYRALADVTRTLLESYPALAPDRIVGHSTIAPGRKSDPGPAFDWHYYQLLIAEDVVES
jgi:AmpD protein